MLFVVFFILMSSVCRADWKMDLVMINKPFLISQIPFSKTLLHSTTGCCFCCFGDVPYFPLLF